MLPASTKSTLFSGLCLFGFGYSLFGQALTVDFERPVYITGVGESTPVRVFLDSPIPSGLFSFGVKLLFDSGSSPVSGFSSISVPSELDFNGVLGPGVFKQVGDGFAGTKGTVDFFALPPQSYSGSSLVSFDLRFTSPGIYDLRLDLFNTLGPSESVFVSGNGDVLDNRIEFGRTIVQVVPEPHSLFFFAIGVLAASCGGWKVRTAELRATQYER